MNQVYILSIQQMIDIANGGKFPGTGYKNIPPIYLNGGTSADDHSGTSSATVLGEAAALNALLAAGFNEDYITSAQAGKKEYFFSLGGAIANALINISLIQGALSANQAIINAFNLSVTTLTNEIEQLQMTSQSKKKMLVSNTVSPKGTGAPTSLLQSAIKMQSFLINSQDSLSQINPLLESISVQLTELESLPSSGITNIVPQLQTLLASVQQSTTNIENSTTTLANLAEYWNTIEGINETAIVAQIQYLIGVIQASETDVTDSTQELLSATTSLTT